MWGEIQQGDEKPGAGVVAYMIKSAETELHK